MKDKQVTETDTTKQELRELEADLISKFESKIAIDIEYYQYLLSESHEDFYTLRRELRHLLPTLRDISLRFGFFKSNHERATMKSEELTEYMIMLIQGTMAWLIKDHEACRKQLNIDDEMIKEMLLVLKDKELDNGMREFLQKMLEQE